MNLAQAAAVICYEFAQSSVVVRDNEEAGVTLSEIDRVLEGTRRALSISGFLTRENEERMLMEIRGSMMRFGLTRRELSLWLGALRRICQYLEK
jgi:tRNA C32,U32 (ribose-2'-O)-methylase TrmJ